MLEQKNVKVARCDCCEFEKQCVELPPCIKDAYEQGKNRELSIIYDYWIGSTTKEFVEWLTDRAENYLLG